MCPSLCIDAWLVHGRVGTEDFKIPNPMFGNTGILLAAVLVLCHSQDLTGIVRFESREVLSTDSPFIHIRKPGFSRRRTTIVCEDQDDCSPDQKTNYHAKLDSLPYKLSCNDSPKCMSGKIPLMSLSNIQLR